MSDKAWYYEAMCTVVGPVSPAELRELIAKGTVVAETRVRRGADGDWHLAGEVRGFAQVPRLARLVALPHKRIWQGGLAVAGVVGMVFGIFLGIVMVARNSRHNESVRTAKSSIGKTGTALQVGETGLTWDQLQALWQGGTIADWGKL